MYQIIHRNFPLIEDVRNEAIKFFTKKYLEYSIDNVLINNIFFTTIHNYIDWKWARYRYLEQIPHVTIAIIYHVVLAFFCSIVATFRLGKDGICKQYCINSLLQIIMSIASLYLSVLGSISPRLAMNTTLFYGEKIIEIFDRDKDETEKICIFIKNFWSKYRIRMQGWMLSSKKLTSHSEFDYQIGIMNIHKKLKNLSDVKNLFQYTLQLHR